MHGCLLKPSMHAYAVSLSHLWICPEGTLDKWMDLGKEWTAPLEMRRSYQVPFPHQSLDVMHGLGVIYYILQCIKKPQNARDHQTSAPAINGFTQSTLNFFSHPVPTIKVWMQYLKRATWKHHTVQLNMCMSNISWQHCLIHHIFLILTPSKLHIYTYVNDHCMWNIHFFN